MKKAADFIIEFLIEKGIKDIFGYPGGVICHFMDSATKYPEIKTHLNYNEQASAFAATAYAQAKCDVGVAFATSGPGATNLITGIADAWYDSVPVLFFTGQVDTYGLKESRKIRQRGFQETEIVDIVRPITKYAVQPGSAASLKEELEKAYYIATHGRPGPVLIDLPADVQRAMADFNALPSYEISHETDASDETAAASLIMEKLECSKRPTLLVGAGVRQAKQAKALREFAEKVGIPVVTSMPGCDFLESQHPLNFGFIGANGKRYANFILSKSDYILALGTRLDLKQVGNNRDGFAPDAILLRVDVDEGELAYSAGRSQLSIKADLNKLIPLLRQRSLAACDSTWLDVANCIRNSLRQYDMTQIHQKLALLSAEIDFPVSYTVDVGQSQLWCVQSLQLKKDENVYMSAGLGSMGYSLPAAIGVAIARNTSVICLNGDGGLQMNLQELQFVSKEKLPIKIVVLNNHSLGMIRQFQEVNFAENYTMTTEQVGYGTPNWSNIAGAYGIPYTCLQTTDDVKNYAFALQGPEFVEIVLPEKTYLYPNFGRNVPFQDQIPEIDRELYHKLLEL